MRNCQLVYVEGSNNVTPAIPLCDEFVLEKRLEITCEKHIHVDPHATVMPDDKQTNKVAIDPRLLVVQLKKLACLHSRTLGECGDVSDTK